ncbi:MAG TPA: DUF4232 domain-containing protein [Candidatus Saccharimonadales bacterium]|nr:DUF4232 domain-containing protein [Candidatus Saccharimonadales bacterium]
MRRALVPAVLLATAGVLAACGSSSPAVTSTEPTTLPVTPTPLVTAPPEPTPTPTATPPVPCMPGQFGIAILNSQGAAGTIYATFEIRNTSTSDCTENGYAKLQMLTAGGGLLATTWSNDNSVASPGPVDLPPGTEPLGAVGASGHGYFLVSWTDVTCSAAQAETPKFWQVTLPTSRFQTDVTDIGSSMVCGGAIKIGPIKSAPYT